MMLALYTLLLCPVVGLSLLREARRQPVRTEIPIWKGAKS